MKTKKKTIPKQDKPELLAPVQDYISLKTAVDSGADAVYFGIRGFNMRAGAKNFTTLDLPKISKIAHSKGVRVFLAINTIIYEEELKNVEKILEKAKKAKIDAIICWDMAVMKIAKKLDFEIHLSTQASVANSEAAEFYRKAGANRIILARECSLEQIKKIKKACPKIEIEIFIHGAMCVSVSGRCFISQFLHNKSANRGECLQPCRRKYLIKQVSNGDGKNTELEIAESYVLSPKDLCTIDFFEKLMDVGVDCFKIEGRNRSPEYVATTTKAYRTLIDFLSVGSRTSNRSKDGLNKLKTKLKNDVKKVYNRKFGSGFFLGKPISEWTNSYGSQATEKKIHIGIVSHYYKKIGVAEILIQANKSIKIGDTLIFQGPTTGSHKQKIESMEIDHKPIKKALQGDKVAIKLRKIVHKNDQVYIIKKV